MERASTNRWLAGAVRTELARLRGLVGAQLADQALVERLERRLRMQEGRPVAKLEGWLLRRGLPQKPGCWSHLCDDGMRIDTGSGCPSCDSVRGDRRALRHSVASAVAAELPQLPFEERRSKAERRLHHEVQIQAAVDLARREHALLEHAERQEAVARQREELAAAEDERAAAACEECGIPEAAGLCLVCTSDRRTENLLRQAVDMTVAVRADLDDLVASEAFVERVAADTRRMLDGAVELSGNTPAAVLAFTRATLAEQILDGRRTSALEHLAAGEEAETEAERAFEAGMRRQHRYATPSLALRAAEEATEKAREAAARTVLRDRLARLVQGRSITSPEQPGWGRRCAELARRPLAHELTAASGAVVLAEGLASAT
ncbi:hypothetical protein [Streptomyces sp. NPDC058394]|uniref:hypothetical protein n=1 Tax=Streptomyces sp. NPDC058394 TaxID=3346477 RepID=UPI00365E2E83